MAREFDAQELEVRWQRTWADEGTYEVENKDPRSHFYALTHVPLPLGGGPPGPRPQLHLRGPRRALPHDAGLRGPLAARLRLVRAPGGERRDQDRLAPAPLHRGADRRAQGVAHPPRRGLRLATRGAKPRPALHPRQPAHLPQALGAGPRLPGERDGELVPGLPDGARERAGPRGRHVRALRGPRRAPRARAVVPRDHAVRRRAPGRARGPRVARAREDHAAQLDRPLRGGRVRPPRRRPGGPRGAGVHDAPGHRVRRHLRRPGS